MQIVFRQITIKLLLTLALVALAPGLVVAQGIQPFVGTYVGSADLTLDGETKSRDMSVTIAETRKGYSVEWTSTTFKSDGRTKTKAYEVGFVPSQRDNIYASAMKTNVFGKAVPLDPLQGEPFVWGRIEGDTFTVFSLFINEAGEYEMQEYHRTLVEGGLNLEFLRVRNGVAEKGVTAFLKKQ
ncbi:MAG: hypothetical protein AAF393_05590 [Pseudomonadota bacterium]